jgi:hypothetical protein
MPHSGIVIFRMTRSQLNFGEQYMLFFWPPYILLYMPQKLLKPKVMATTPAKIPFSEISV